MTRPAVPDALLRLEGVSLAFAGIRALVDVGFAVAPGEICALIGPNGAGKSSLLNVVSGVYRPQRGTIRIDGVAHEVIRPRRAAQLGIARTFQNLALWKGMTVIETLLTGRALHARASFFEEALGIGRARSDARIGRARAEEILERLDLAQVRHEPVGRLPYGLQKRVDLGRALAAAPRLILLDEPMAGMTFDEKRAMSAALAAMSRELGITLVLIEHDMGVVMELSHHVVVLDHGEIIADGTPAAVRDDARVIDAYLGVPHDEVPPLAAAI